MHAQDFRLYFGKAETTTKKTYTKQSCCRKRAISGRIRIILSFSPKRLLSGGVREGHFHETVGFLFFANVDFWPRKFVYLKSTSRPRAILCIYKCTKLKIYVGAPPPTKKSSPIWGAEKFYRMTTPGRLAFALA